MKLLYVYHSLSTRGGLERVLADKMNWLADVAGYDVYFLTTDQLGDAPAYPISDKIHWLRYEEKRFHNIYKVSYPKRYFALRSYNKYLKRSLESALKEVRPDVLISTTSFAMEVVASMRTAAKKVCESHIAYPYIMKAGPKHRYMPKLEYVFKTLYDIQFRSVIKAYDELVVLTQDDHNYWKPYRTTTVIPNPVTSYPDEVSPLEEEGRKSIISVGRLHGQKGYDMLIEAWSRLAEKHKGWHIDIFGDGVERQKYLDMIASKGLQEGIIIHPSSNQIYAEYQKADFLVLSSRAEGFGLVLAEAMACGRPCVAFDCESGPRDIIADKEDGLLVPAENVDKLTEAIDWMIEHPSERCAMGRLARENAKRYAIDSVMPLWMTLFERLIHS